MDQPQYQSGSCPIDTPGMTAMRSLVLIYHEDFEADITGIVQRGMGVARYTKVHNVTGARVDTFHDVDYQPESRNHMLIIVADCTTVQSLAAALRDLRAVKGHGVRGYITPEEVI
jgi:hypothetical protein